ncbi:hypothetical protein ACVWXO_008880 [Bradyrhizobium sp. LM2.7]
MSETKPQAINVASDVPTGNTPDPFDLANLRLSQSFTETVGVKKLVTTVPVRKPNPQDWVRVRPEPEFRDNFAVIELKDDHEEYIIATPLIPELIGEFVNKTFFTAINRQGALFLWPVRLPEPDGRQLDWYRSAREAAEKAMTRWIRSKANRSLGAYDIFEAEIPIPEPVWPELTFQEIVKVAFRDRLIMTTDHPVIKRLRGLS